MRERIQKILSQYGVASRRAAEGMIVSGRVMLNGRAAALGDKADPACDRIEIDGCKLDPLTNRVYIMLNKPRGCLTAMKDDRGRKTVSELVRDCPARVYPVGRLDYNSEGLLIMTNDGALTQRLTHPSGEKAKVYHVSVRGELTAALGPLSSPLVIDGYTVRPARVRVLTRTPSGGVLEMTIYEGRNRQIRKLCAACGLEVRRLVRVEVAGLTLSGVEPGQWRYLTREETAKLKLDLSRKP